MLTSLDFLKFLEDVSSLIQVTSWMSDDTLRPDKQNRPFGIYLPG